MIMSGVEEKKEFKKKKTRRKIKSHRKKGGVMNRKMEHFKKGS